MKKRMMAMLLICVMSLTGCKSIIQEKVDINKQIELSKDTLEQNSYYVKAGSKFVVLHDTKNLTTRNYFEDRTSRLFFLQDDYEAVPTMYQDEVLAYVSSKTELDSVKMVRAREIGFTIPFYGLREDDNGYYSGSVNSNTLEKSNLQEYLLLDKDKSEFKLVNVGGIPITKNMVATCGVLNCLERNGKYLLDYYYGSEYRSTEFIADTMVLEYFEDYELTDIELTKNGYFSIKMPKDAKSGWYFVEGGGLFRYYAVKRGEDISSIDINDEYYTEEMAAQNADTQLFSVNFDMKMRDIGIQVEYALPENTEEVETAAAKPITGQVTSPNGTEYAMQLDSEKQVLICALDEAQAGKWNITISPSDLQVIKANIISTESQQEMTTEDTVLTLDADSENLEFVVNYIGSDNIYAMLVGSNGEVEEFTKVNNAKQLVLKKPYMTSGDYTVRTYHFADSTVEEVKLEPYTVDENEGIITVTE